MSATQAAAPGEASRRVSFREALLFWLELGFINFGGPTGQIAIMHRELVERRRWISEERFLHALNYCMLLPGPEAQQLAIYVGWLLHRTPGGLVAGIFFVLPAFFLILGLSWLWSLTVWATFAPCFLWIFLGAPYIERLRGNAPLNAAFSAITAAVVGVILSLAVWMGLHTLTDSFSVVVAVVTFVGLRRFQCGVVPVVVGSALAGLLHVVLRVVWA